MIRIKHAFMGAALLFLPATTFANPVSFKDGWGVMPTVTPDWSDLDVNYSFTNRDAIGFSNFYRKGSDSTADFGILRYNRLLVRWNELDSQANMYGSIGAGGRHDSKEDDSVAGFGSFEADYETRRIYTLISAERLQSGEGIEFGRVRYRAGFAPYQASFTSLQTWIVTQIDYMPEMDDRVVVTPLLRFFYNNFALEAGVDLNGKLFLAGMAHF